MKTKCSIYWIGVRESEIYDANDLFDGSITTYGSNKNGNYAFDKSYNYRYDCNADNNNWIDFVNDNCKHIIEIDENAKFMLYYSPEYSDLDDDIKERVICNNSETIIDFLDNKITSRIWVSEFINTVPYAILSKSKISYKYLKKRFPNYSDFVLQHCESSGGSGTLYINKSNHKNVIKELPRNRTCSISPYIENNVSINVHIMIYEDEIIFFPPSIQLIENYNNHLTYMGNDFEAYNGLDNIIKRKIHKASIKIGKNLKKIGYLGICGIDFIATKDDVVFMEINPRFQASTVILNKWLNQIENDLSIQKLQIDAFSNPKCSYNITNAEINHSIYFYKYKKDYDNKLKYHHSICCENTELFYCIDDALDWNYKIDENAYLFSLITNRSISHINPDNNCVIDQNFDIYNSEIIDIDSIEDNLIALKIMLLNQGVRISDKATKYISDNGGLNFEEFQAVDMKIFEKYFNVPIMTRFICISPFEIDLSSHNHYVLNYYGKEITKVELRGKNPIGDTNINESIIASDITYLSNDRLRIFHRSGCFFKENNLGCKFCDVENESNIFTIKDIKSAIDLYSDSDNVNHYLIGGGSENPNSDFEMIIEIAKCLRSKNNKKISIMTTPPRRIEILKKLKSAGIEEVIFNIEIFNRDFAKFVMPGKGVIPLEVYDAAFKASVGLFGKGNVRSMLILCLESIESFLAGIEYLCSLGVYPTLSLFKPIEGTPLEKYIPPSNKEILDIYKEVEKICNKHNVNLGPSCRYCEDNTIKISS